MTMPRELIVYPAGRFTFRLSDYPWLTWVQITAQGGASSDGNPGTSDSMVLPASELDSCLTIVVGKGGRGADGRRGEDGLVIIELYDTAL